ncbi:TPA: hypothetical protein N0F65_004619 [Lagenidium giganteum]|uniref:Inositol polyphosphate-related phosphatase domain-containing protein n=1 Tax=Lagenidium giganteum TaxID=4803 RepID=A0AAV2ZDB8_9STRA|nr:TPA: hypothetical protein N0F65_004619 [Lagenidium giganteum]
MKAGAASGTAHAMPHAQQPQAPSARSHGNAHGNDSSSGGGAFAGRAVVVRGRAFTELETPTYQSASALDMKHADAGRSSNPEAPYKQPLATRRAVTAAGVSPSSPVQTKVVEIKRLVSPSRRQDNGPGPMAQLTPPSAPATAPAAPLVAYQPPNGAASDALVQAPSQTAQAAAGYQQLAAAKAAWQQEAARLSMRVQELQHENEQLLKQHLTSQRRLSASAGPSTRTGADSVPKPRPSRMLKSQSCVEGFGFVGLSVAEAAAASHRSRSRRSGKKDARKLGAGYWNNEKNGNGNVKSSFSCNNLADMEQRALKTSEIVPQARPLTLKKSHSTSTRNMTATRDALALLNSFNRKSDSFNRSSSTGLDESPDFLAHQQKAAVAKGFRAGSSLGAAAPLQTTEKDDLDTEDPPVRITSPRSYLEAGLLSQGGSFNLGRSMRSSSAPKRLSSCDVRLWVGTWNMGAADPFVDSGGLMDEQKSAAMLEEFVPRGYQLYVLGIQEGVSENVYHAVLAYLQRNEEGMSYARLTLKNSDFMVLNKGHPADATIDAVRGRGDGAFMGTKFTGLAVFYAESIRDKVKLVRAGVHKFNLTSGSKGGVAVALMVNQTTMVFVNCHLDARNDGYRREQIRNLNANLGRIMGHYSFDLTEQFHHVVWMGDMNYRIVNINAQVVLELLEKKRNTELHDKFDGLLNDRNNSGIFDGFVEPTKFPNFYPTYKKFPKRGYVDESSSSWPTLTYRVLYKEPFYKGGKVKKRVPGWCDRILIHSLVVSDSKLVPEKVLSPFSDTPAWIDNYQSVNHGVGMDVSDHSPVFATFVLSCSQPTNANMVNLKPHDLARRSSRSYSAAVPMQIEDQYRRSVGGSYFDQPRVVQRINNLLNRPVSTVLTIHNMQLSSNGTIIVPKRCRIVAPLVGEDVKQCDVIGERSAGNSGNVSLSLNALMQHSRPIQHLHMLMWVKNDNICGHCCVSLKRIARLEETGEAKFRVPLSNNSMRLYNDGNPVTLMFSVRSKTFAK